MKSEIYLPSISSDEFLAIFLDSSFVLLFGVAFASLVTLSKMGFLSKIWGIFGYSFWVIQVYFLYDLGVRIGSSEFTTKILAFAMLAYLFTPHLYFMLVKHSEKRYQSDLTQEEKNYG